MATAGKEEKKAKERRPQAIKRDLQNERHRLRNKAFKSNVRTVIRDFEEIIDKGEAAATQESLNEVYSVLDKAVKRNIFKLNKASRLKARLTARTLAPRS